MTFSIPRTNVIVSDDGFSVEMVSRTEFHYVENGARWHIEIEFLADDAVPIVVYQNTIASMGANDGERMPPGAQRDRIVENIRLAMRFRGVEIDVM